MKTTLLAPDVQPIKVKSYSCKQSKYEHVPELPMRSIVYGPSGAGKGVLLSNLILDIYKGCFERVFIFSPSIDIDHTWDPVKKYVKHTLGVDTKKEPAFFSTYEPKVLADIMDRQFKIAEWMKKNGQHVFSILIVIDDFADTPSFTRQSTLLHQLYIRGRHAFISTITSVQKATTLAPLIRTQATHTFTFKLRSLQDLETWLHENSAVYDKQTLLKIYKAATTPRYGFLYMNLMAHDPRDMFFYKFEARIIPNLKNSQ